jgi:hypothetical protein
MADLISDFSLWKHLIFSRYVNLANISTAFKRLDLHELKTTSIHLTGMVTRNMQVSQTFRPTCP